MGPISIFKTVRLTAWSVFGVVVAVSVLTTADFIQCPLDGPCPPGTPRDDIILGTEEGDSASGGDGNDMMLGGPGDDIIEGDGGNDFLDGGEGDDFLFGDEGDDILDGGPGIDVIDAGPGNDKVNIEPGDVRFEAEGGEIIDCGPGSDTVNFIGFGPLTFDQPPDPIEFIVIDPVTQGRYRVLANCERVNGLAQPPTEASPM